MAVKQRREFLKVQWGDESVPGTFVPATAVAGGLTDIRYRPDTTVNTPAKLNGSLAVANDVAILSKAGIVTLGGYATFEDMGYLLEMGYKHVAATGDGGSPQAYTRVWAPTLTQADDPHTKTVEVGTNAEAFRMPYSWCETFGLTARVKDFTNFTATIRGQDFYPAAFTPSLTPHAISRILGQKWKAFITPADTGTMGGGEVLDCITDIAFNSGPLYMWANCMNGLLTPESHVQQGQQPTATVTFQLSPTSLQMLQDYLDGRKLFVRLLNEGDPIHGSTVVTPPATPLTGAVGAAGALTGTYSYKYTYVNQYGETLPSAATASPVAATADQINLSAITVSADPSVIARRIYRTDATGTGTYKYVATINDNTTTTYIDNLIDTDLGVAAPTANTAISGTLVFNSFQIDLCAAITAFPDVGQAVSEGSLSVPITFTGTQDDGGSWGKLIEYTLVNELATLP